MDSLVDRNPQGLFESKYFAMRYALCVGAIHVVLLVWGSFAHGPGWDEVGHLAAGWSHWKTSRTDLYRVNPPLVRMLATVPLLGKDPKIEFDRNSQYNLGRPEFDDGADLIFKHGNGYLTLLRMARLACLIFAISALWIIWTWSYEMFGASGAMLSVTIWAFSPMVLNNAHLITPDVGAAAVGTCACYTFFWWLKRGTLRLAFLSGLLLGTALLTKFTWLLLAGLWPVQWFGQRMFGPLPCGNKGYRKPTFGQAALLVAVSWFVFNLGYGFEGSFERLDRYSFYSSALSGNERPNEGDPILGNRFAGKFLGAMPVPLPRNVLLGVDRQKVDFESKMPSYLREKWRTHG
ncbi:MAG: glycosyltransferase family 39 protein, partial [Planctomycetaceae bacterium]|nr:glycosyltransferase family 39 protein [Planctomycetaceae bacterium]